MRLKVVFVKQLNGYSTKSPKDECQRNVRDFHLVIGTLIFDVSTSPVLKLDSGVQPSSPAGSFPNIDF
jgi:hypothetical protein